MTYQFTGDDALPPGRRRLAELGWNVARFVNGFGPRGPIGPPDGPPVLVIPGFLATDRTTLPLRKALAQDGWRVHGWGLGWNRGVRHDTILRLRERLDQISDEPILLVGWSLGGLFARELARERPDRVRAVITLGSPFSGDPHQNHVWRLYEWVAKHKVDDPPVPRITDKPPVPNLALWSRKDGLIAPRAAKGLEHERDEAVELDCAHMAFGVSHRAAAQVTREIHRFLKWNR
ncbi:MAG TPA: alpha/beta fold hydrolase [Sphingomicrobium sp.]|nr:alpha/beta fold hydrolase [Sphingomicrobium sp.]